MNREVYELENLKLGIVEYFERDKSVMGIHVLVDTPYPSEKYDLNLCKVISDSGEKEIFFPKTLVPFNELLMNSRINFGSLDRENALKVASFLPDRFMKFMRIKRVSLTLNKK